MVRFCRFAKGGKSPFFLSTFYGFCAASVVFWALGAYATVQAYIDALTANARAANMVSQST